MGGRNQNCKKDRFELETKGDLRIAKDRFELETKGREN